MDNELFELMTKIYGEMQEGFKRLDGEIAEVKKDVKETKGRVVNIENDNHKNFTALFDGYKQNSDILDRIETEVSRQEEVILRKTK